MILSQQVSEQDVEEMLAFYRANFATVDLVTCSKCGSYMCFLLTGGDAMGMAVNELGKIIVPIGDAMMSSRVRLDEAPNGERMMGYKCGQPIANPLYAPAIAEWQKSCAKVEKDHKRAVAVYQKRYEEEVLGVKPGEPIPEPQPAVLNLPPRPGIAEFIPCGNNTILSKAELAQIPMSHWESSLSPFEKSKIAEKIRTSGYRADFKKVGNIKHFETFAVERLK